MTSRVAIGIHYNGLSMFVPFRSEADCLAAKAFLEKSDTACGQTYSEDYGEVDYYYLQAEVQYRTLFDIQHGRRLD